MQQSRATCIAVVLLLIVLPIAAAACPSIKVEWRDGRLSVDAENALLREVLRTVSLQTGVQFEGWEGIQERVSLHFSALPLGEALQKLLAHVDYAMSGEISRTAELRIMVFGRQGTAPDQPTVTQRTQRTKTAQVSQAPKRKPRPTMPDQASPALDEGALRSAIVSRDPEVLARAFNTWFPLDYKAATAALVEATRNEDSEVRLHALQLLNGAQYVDAKTVSSTLGEALGDDNLEVRIYAVSALAQRGGPEAMSYLRKALHDENALVRLMVIQSVTGKPEGLSLIKEAAQGDPDESVRNSAALLLSQAQSQTK